MHVHQSVEWPSLVWCKQATYCQRNAVGNNVAIPVEEKNWRLRQMLCSLQSVSFMLVVVIVINAKFDNDSLANAVDIPAVTSCNIPASCWPSTKKFKPVVWKLADCVRHWMNGPELGYTADSHRAASPWHTKRNATGCVKKTQAWQTQNTTSVMVGTKPSTTRINGYVNHQTTCSLSILQAIT